MSKDNVSEEISNIVSTLSETLKAVIDAPEAISKADLKKLKNQGQEALNQATNYLKENSSQFVDKAKQAASTAQDYAKENPWKTAAIAALVTYAINSFLSRKK